MAKWRCEVFNHSKGGKKTRTKFSKVSYGKKGGKSIHEKATQRATGESAHLFHGNFLRGGGEKKSQWDHSDDREEEYHSLNSHGDTLSTASSGYVHAPNYPKEKNKPFQAQSGPVVCRENPSRRTVQKLISNA